MFLMNWLIMNWLIMNNVSTKEYHEYKAEYLYRSTIITDYKRRVKMIYSIIKSIRLLTIKVRDDYVAAFSAQAALFTIISFFPFVMLLLGILQYTSITRSMLMTMFTQVFPTGINSMVISVVDEIYNSSLSKTLISVTAITTLWSAGKGFLAIMKGLNSVYEIKESRNYFFVRITATIYTLIFAFMIIVTITLFVFGNQLYLWVVTKFPVLKDLALLVISLRTLVGLITLIVFFLLIYTVIPNRKTKLINQLPGAIISAAGWMGFSYAFSFYIDNFSSYSSTYGSLTAIVLFILWLYFCMYILFIGAEINLLLENKEFLIHK